MTTSDIAKAFEDERDMVRAIRAAAIEECARVCDGEALGSKLTMDQRLAITWCADAIRALKEKP